MECSQLKDWSPIIDVSVANALVNDDDDDGGVGKRCSYIGNEESDNETKSHYRSLNVEELAIEEYSAGKLPQDSNLLQGGGWKGWHSEGVHVRVLFRILLSDSLMRYDYHYQECPHFTQLSLEQVTIFLTPYQSSPLDLHVGHCLLQTSPSPTPIRGFYERRKIQIEDYLNRLKSLSPQELSDLVHESIIKQKQMLLEIGKPWIKDTRLLKDLKEARTLSMLAASFGGKLLSSMFRCLCYDYRQYGGGLPDLTLVRAGQNSNKFGEFGNWNEWIGEGFVIDQAERSKALILDRDDEFLGGRLNEKQRTSSSQSNKHGTSRNDVETNKDPDRLVLSHDGEPLLLQSMFVEVKSANDTLDARQEDWLNIIGSHGEARVCKFKPSKKTT